ncbi:hypothetical protein [Histidinibacterium lentulum]|uniref:Uncharacterized protein n=1 Tax=Histidinibacterium lentulum TaxID=2480588 RepID=A0A3N2QTI2_9RHOB|nr:hypothetical protein [Histidinibacterium lentulum]ROT98503.1 hypothetical protein EAT49_16305 [Histidinibacterium lentulum]
MRTTAAFSGSLLALLAMLAGPGRATVIDVPGCVMDMDAGRLATSAAEARPITSAHVWANDFVTYSWSGDADERVVLQHCPTGDFLLVVAPPAVSAVVFERFFTMLGEERGYTLRQLGEAVAPLGAGARIGRGEWGDCICRELGL